VADEDLLPGQWRPRAVLLEWQPQLLLAAALKAGLIGALLEAPLSPHEAAEKLALDADATRRAIDALVDAGCLERQGERVLVAPAARPQLDPGDEAFAGDRLLYLHDLFTCWVQLPQVLRDGGPARCERTPESLRAFVGSMRLAARKRARPLVDRLESLFPGTRTVLDIGGGPGTQARAFSEHGWQTTVLDLPEVIDLAAHGFTEAGISTIKGDATRGIPAYGTRWRC